MKKLLILCAAAAMLLAACGTKKEKSLYDQGLELVSLMGEMVQSDAYFEMFSAASQVKDAVAGAADAAKAGRYQTPKAVYKISAEKDGLMGMLANAAGADLNLDSMSEELKAYVWSRSLTSLASILNTSAGMEAIAASSIYMCSKTFVCSEAADSTIYLYTYEDACPVAVTFLVGEDHAVYASAAYILNKDITDGDSLTALLGFSGLKAEPLEF